MARYIGLPVSSRAAKAPTSASSRRPAPSTPSASWSRSPASTAPPPARQAVRLRHPAFARSRRSTYLRPAGASVPQLLQEGVEPEGQHRREPAAAAGDASRQRRLPHGLRGHPRRARQLVSHRGVTVNGKIVNLPSYQVKAGDAIALAERAQKQLRVQEALTVAQQMDLSPSWIEVDAKKFRGRVQGGPDRADLPADINEALIVELYSK